MSISSGRSKARSAVVVLAAAALTIAAAATVVSVGSASADTTATPDMFVASTVEDEGADCPVPSTGPGSNSRLPDPFRKANGTRITTKADWRCLRAETRELAERFVYGDKPAKPATVTGSVSSSSITVNVSHQGRSASFSASVQLPTSGGSGPHPAVIVYGGFGADTATIRSAGAAVINFDPASVAREGTPATTSRAPSTPCTARPAAPAC